MAKGLKTGGREKGTPNKLTTVIRETLAEVLQNYTTETLIQDLETLTPAQRVKAITNLYRLSLPPMKSEDSEKESELKPFIITLTETSSRELNG